MGAVHPLQHAIGPVGEGSEASGYSLLQLIDQKFIWAKRLTSEAEPGLNPFHWVPQR